MLDITRILPGPFAWIPIPAEQVTLSRRGGYITAPLTQTVPAFSMARYPITNAQYDVFVSADDGYHQPDWWLFSADARQWHASHPTALPPYGTADHPRTHVTWYECVAFCQWLSFRTDAIIRLPTEAEWQLAGQGTDNRAYPWGDEWDADRCHHNLTHGAIGTLPVQCYEGRGDSPYGVVDMIGNVWEWCLTAWSSGENDPNGDSVRVLRGGSWFDDVMSHFTVTARSSWSVDLASDLRGFRIVMVAS